MDMIQFAALVARDRLYGGYLFTAFWSQVAIAALCATLVRVRSNAYDFSRERTVDATLGWARDA